LNKTDNLISKLEAMLFAAGDPVEASKFAEVLDIDIETVTKMLGHLSALYDERESGLMLIKIDNKYQLCTREAHSEEVRKFMEIKKNTPLSNAAFEVLAIIAYNKTVTRSFIEQVRGVDCSGSISSLVQIDFCVAFRSILLMICLNYLRLKKLKKYLRTIRKHLFLMKRMMIKNLSLNQMMILTTITWRRIK
jgi:segregation and condensation protein B